MKVNGKWDYEMWEDYGTYTNGRPSGYKTYEKAQEAGLIEACKYLISQSITN
jgi:hypothetical protein